MSDIKILTDKELKKKMNKEALLESYNLSKKQQKETRMKKSGQCNIDKVKRVDW